MAMNASQHPLTQEKIGMQPKLRVLMLHSFRTSGKIFRQQVRRAGLDISLGSHLEMIYLDAPHAASGEISKDVSAFFEPPYYEWWSMNKDQDGVIDYTGYEEGVAAVANALRLHAPIHGIVGFSQGSCLTSLLVSYQRQGLLLQDVQQLQFCILFAGTVSRLAAHQSAYQGPIACPSLHVIGEKDWLKPMSEKLAAAFTDPIIIRHDRGHVVPPLTLQDIQAVKAFLRHHAPATANL